MVVGATANWKEERYKNEYRGAFLSLFLLYFFFFFFGFVKEQEIILTCKKGDRS